MMKIGLEWIKLMRGKHLISLIKNETIESIYFSFFKYKNYLIIYVRKYGIFVTIVSSLPESKRSFAT